MGKELCGSQDNKSTSPIPKQYRQKNCIHNKNSHDHLSLTKGEEFEVHCLFNSPKEAVTFIFIFF